jgi:hypothetical protein
MEWITKRSIVASTGREPKLGDCDDLAYRYHPALHAGMSNDSDILVCRIKWRITVRHGDI